MDDDKLAPLPASTRATGSVLIRAMTSPSLTISLNRIPFKLLELRVIAAHDLPPVSKYLHTYVMAWVHPDNKLITPVDHKGNTNPTWNYQMVFGVDDKFLNSKSSAVMMEIYNISKLSNRPIGTTCLPVDILLNNSNSEIIKKPLKLQISRPSGDVQGYLIVTLNLVTTTIRNLNEETENSPRAFNPRTIMIKQISHRLTHSESEKRMTYYEDEEDHDDAITVSDPDNTTMSDPDITTLSDPDITALSDREITALSDHEIAALSDREITALSDHEIAALSEHDNAALSDHDNTAMSDHDNAAMSDHDNAAMSDPESGSNDIETKSLASDVSSAHKDSGMTSPNGENTGLGTSPNGGNSGPGTSASSPKGQNSGPGTSASSPKGQNSGPGTSASSPKGQNSGPGTSASSPKGQNSDPGTAASSPKGQNSDPGTAASSPKGQNSGSGTAASSPKGQNSGPGTSASSPKGGNSGPGTSATSPNGENSGHGSSKFDSWSEAGEMHTAEKADKEKNTAEKANKEKSTKEKANKGKKSKEKATDIDKILMKGEEPKVRSRHRRHSDGGGLLSFFTTAIICGTGTMGNKNTKQKSRKLKKKSKSTKKSEISDLDYSPDQKKLPHDI